MDVVFACTGNICRSPMAEALLRRRLADRAIPVTVGSVGRLFEGRAADELALKILAERDIDFTDFTSRIQDAQRLEGAALVIGMERRHVRDLSMFGGDGFSRAFTLPEFARLATEAGPRPEHLDLASWVRAVGADRDPGEYLRPAPDDEVDDPYGGTKKQFRRCADLIDSFLETIVAVAWPDPTPPVVG